jgi:hypothetical protein
MLMADIHGDSVAVEHVSGSIQNVIHFFAEGQTILAGSGNRGIADQFHQISDDLIPMIGQISSNFRERFIHGNTPLSVDKFMIAQA